MDENQGFMSLAKAGEKNISMHGEHLTIGQLEQKLLAQFPAKYAMPGDRTGLLVGDPGKPVARVAIALDVTPSAIDAALEMGANLLLTHHPAFWDMPERIVRRVDSPADTGAMVFKAASNGLALMNFHTALDISPTAQGMLPGLLGLEFLEVLVAQGDCDGRGYGQVSRIPAGKDELSVAQLSARCVAVFGRSPRVWGNMSRVPKRIATFNGSIGSMLTDDIAQSIDCLIVGEVKYHTALYLSENGLPIIELGHDVSELPYCMSLAAACKAAGVPEDGISIINQSHNWNTPEATRI